MLNITKRSSWFRSLWHWHSWYLSISMTWQLLLLSLVRNKMQLWHLCKHWLLLWSSQPQTHLCTSCIIWVEELKQQFVMSALPSLCFLIRKRVSMVTLSVQLGCLEANYFCITSCEFLRFGCSGKWCAWLRLTVSTDLDEKSLLISTKHGSSQ